MCILEFPLKKSRFFPTLFLIQKCPGDPPDSKVCFDDVNSGGEAVRLPDNSVPLIEFLRQIGQHPAPEVIDLNRGEFFVVINQQYFHGYTRYLLSVSEADRQKSVQLFGRCVRIVPHSRLCRRVSSGADIAVQSALRADVRRRFPATAPVLPTLCTAHIQHFSCRWWADCACRYLFEQ